ncbi:hypothetical protein BD413DRAFT_107167 [Trametes elegans]|nr:hypothetical protein BD413DRAFT_107167 [Trametes elegans]
MGDADGEVGTGRRGPRRVEEDAEERANKDKPRSGARALGRLRSGQVRPGQTQTQRATTSCPRSPPRWADVHLSPSPSSSSHSCSRTHGISCTLGMSPQHPRGQPVLSRLSSPRPVCALLDTRDLRCPSPDGTPTLRLRPLETGPSMGSRRWSAPPHSVPEPIHLHEARHDAGSYRYPSPAIDHKPGRLPLGLTLRPHPRLNSCLAWCTYSEFPMS